MGQHRYRQLFLFLIVLIVPAITIAVQGRRIWTQEGELSRERVDEIRERIALEIGQEIVVRLERIKTHEMVNNSSTTSRPARYSDPAVVAVGWIDGGRLVWPWDSMPKSDGSAADNLEVEKTLSSAKRAEYAERFNDAADLYRQAIPTARTDPQRAEANLGLARILLRLGKRTEAVAIYRSLANLPSDVVSGDGIAYWSSAGALLAEQDVPWVFLDRVVRDLELPTLAPLQMYRFRTILEGVRHNADSAVQQSAAGALERLSARLRDLEDAQKLQKDFAKVRLSATEWQTYQASEIWLVGRGPEGITPRPLVVAVRLEGIRGTLQSDRQGRQAGPRFALATVGDGELINEKLPGLRAVFVDEIADQPSASTPERSLWGLSFALVAMLTLLGGYLLWRDVRREARLAELRTQFVSSVSHELKTPLTSIRMFAELMQMSESINAEHSAFLETIVSESERLTRLLNDVLDFSRIERGQKAYRLEPASLPEIVHTAVRAIQYPLNEQGFSLDLQVNEEIPPATVDRDALQQAILNLLTNAMKYSGKERVIGLRLLAKNGDAWIQVSDRGIGIPEKEHSRIFEKFYRAPIPENREIPGTGLGLALVAHIAQAHGGSVHVKSRPGEGSTFSIRLPLKQSSAA